MKRLTAGLAMAPTLLWASPAAVAQTMLELLESDPQVGITSEDVDFDPKAAFC